jgi:hypothetical protein
MESLNGSNVVLNIRITGTSHTVCSKQVLAAERSFVPKPILNVLSFRQERCEFLYSLSSPKSL